MVKYSNTKKYQNHFNISLNKSKHFFVAKHLAAPDAVTHPMAKRITTCYNVIVIKLCYSFKSYKLRLQENVS